MPHIKTIVLFALLSLSLPAWSIGAESDGNELLSDCGAAIARLDNPSRDTGRTMGMGFCFGLVRAMLDMNQLYVAHLKGSGLFCPPGNSTHGQALRVVIKYLHDHPEELHKRDTALMFTALKAAFPCTKK